MMLVAVWSKYIAASEWERRLWQFKTCSQKLNVTISTAASVYDEQMYWPRGWSCNVAPKLVACVSCILLHGVFDVGIMPDTTRTRRRTVLKSRTAIWMLMTRGCQLKHVSRTVWTTDAHYQQLLQQHPVSIRISSTTPQATLMSDLFNSRTRQLPCFSNCHKER